jgi:hypothetical protein
MKDEAIVSSVKVEGGVVLVDAYSPRRPNSSFNNVPLLRPFVGMMPAPKEGDHVVISETDTGTKYVEGLLTTPNTDSEPPSIEGEEFAIHFDSGTKIIAEKDGSGGYNLTLNASGDVTIGDAANAVELAVQNHTHDYEDDAGAGGVSTKTTSEPNESGTSTTVE